MKSEGHLLAPDKSFTTSFPHPLKPACSPTCPSYLIGFPGNALTASPSGVPSTA